MRGAGRATFAGVLLLIAGTINIIYGIGALDSANIYANDTRYIFTNLNTMGWVLILLGLIQLAGGASLFMGNTFGRVIGIVGKQGGGHRGYSNRIRKWQRSDSAKRSVLKTRRRKHAVEKDCSRIRG